MSAVEGLGRQFTHLYHGTTADIEGAVRPAGKDAPHSVHGHTGQQYGQRADEHAFATETEDDAWNWAQAAKGWSTLAPRTRVYKVARPADAQLGVYHPDHPARNTTGPGRSGDRIPEHVSKTGFPVLERLDIKPGHQGTFPEENWGKYSRFHSLDVNHPDWNDVRFGHSGSEMRDGFSADWAKNWGLEPSTEERMKGQQEFALDSKDAPKGDPHERLKQGLDVLRR